MVCNEMEILNFIMILIGIEFRHSGNSDCSSSWLAQLMFAVPYMAGLITRATLEIAPWKRINYLVDLPTKSVTRTILLDRIHAHS